MRHAFDRGKVDGLTFTESAPVAPVDGELELILQNLVGRPMLSTLDVGGVAMPLQPSLGFTSAGRWCAQGGGPGVNNTGNIGLATTSSGGTLTGRTPNESSLAESLCRTGVVSSAGAGSVATLRGSSGFPKVRRGIRGFFYVARFFVSDVSLVATANMFVGFAPSSLILTDVAPSGLANLLGFGCDSGDTTLQLYAAGAVAQPRVSVGANFPVNTINADVYEVAMYAAPGGSSVRWRVARLNTGDVASGTISAAANLPDATTNMTPELFRSNGGTAAAVAFDFTHFYLEGTY